MQVLGGFLQEGERLFVGLWKGLTKEKYLYAIEIEITCRGKFFFFGM